MAYKVPEFPLAVDIFTNDGLGEYTLRVSTVGNLAPGRRTSNLVGVANGWDRITAYTFLLVPFDTDIRDGRSGFADLVMVPADDTSPYLVVGVIEVGAGFANHYRRCLIIPLTDLWGLPYPVIPNP